MSNMKAVSFTIQKVWQILKVLLQRNRQGKNYMYIPPIYRSVGIKVENLTDLFGFKKKKRNCHKQKITELSYNMNQNSIQNELICNFNKR